MLLPSQKKNETLETQLEDALMEAKKAKNQLKATEEELASANKKIEGMQDMVARQNLIIKDLQKSNAEAKQSTPQKPDNHTTPEVKLSDTSVAEYLKNPGRNELDIFSFFCAEIAFIRFFGGLFLKKLLISPMPCRNGNHLTANLTNRCYQTKLMHANYH